MKPFFQFAALLLLLANIGAPVSHVRAQGALNPTAAPAPTMKTLAQIEPRIPIFSIPTNLTAAGSYYLTGNLVQTANSAGITVGASDITIDMNGFALVGTNGAADGITTAGAARTNVCVRNGTIRNWAVGLNLLGGSKLAVAENLTILNNSSNGIFLSARAVVTNCRLCDNGGYGINSVNSSVTDATIIRDCVLIGNVRDAIRAVDSVYIEGNYCLGRGAGSGIVSFGLQVSGLRNYIANNHISGFDDGIVVGGSDDFIFRNTVVACTVDYAIAGGNTIGPINNVSGPATNNPWANFAE